MFVKQPALSDTNRSKAARIEEDEVQIESETAETSSPVQLYLFINREAGYRKSSNIS